MTGSRGFSSIREPVEEWARALPEDALLMEGECPDSPDVWARDAFLENHSEEQLFRRPANWPAHGKRAGLVRNERMVKEGRRLQEEHCWTVQVHAFWDGRSAGTPHMIRVSRCAGLCVTTHAPTLEPRQ